MYRLDGVVIGRIAEEGERVVVEAVAAAGTGTCPACGQTSVRIHSRYTRVLADLPACGRPVQVRLTVRRFRCANPTCARRTFAEQVPGATRPHGQTVRRLDAVLAACCIALGGEAGARLAEHIGVADLATFAAGLRHERAELLAALTLPWSTSPVEGHITRLKLIKRQGYGRCGLDTLKRRFLRAA